jgi:error-prone DNA polymerase
VSDWDCTIEPDGRVRLGLRYVAGLREQVGRAIAATVVQPPAPPARCPKCGCDDRSMLEVTTSASSQSAIRNPQSAIAQSPIVNRQSAMWSCFCNLCAHDWTTPQTPARKFTSPEDLIRKTGTRRDELTVLAEIGALAAFGYDRRAALWQIEKAVRPEGELFELPIDDCRLTITAGNAQVDAGPDQLADVASDSKSAKSYDESAKFRQSAVGNLQSAIDPSPLKPMQPLERMAADFAGTSLTIGPHPMSFHRASLALKGVLRAVDLPRQRPGRRVRVAGCVITRQRPGTAKGFVFLTLEDETGISNVIVRPQVYDEQRLAIIESSFVIVDGLLQHQDGVTAIQAERVLRLEGVPLDVASHDFR